LIHTDATGIDAVGIDERRGRSTLRTILSNAGIAASERWDLHSPAQLVMSANCRGYRDALEAAGIAYDPTIVLIPIDHSIKASFHAMDELMAQDDAPSAIFATSDLTALAALRWAAKSNFKVHEELVIVGFDDTDYVAQATTPILSIHNDVEQLATEAVERLLFLIANKELLPPAETRSTPGRLIIRDSS